MGHSSHSSNLHQLEDRVERVERALSQRSSLWERLRTGYRQKSEEGKARIVGWFIITVTLLNLTVEGVSTTFGAALHIVALLLGFWLLLKSLGIFEMSDSMYHLHQLHRTHKRVSAYSMHGTFLSSQRKKSGSTLTNVQILTLFFGGVVLVGVIGWLSLALIEQQTWKMIPFLILAIGAFFYPWSARLAWVHYAIIAIIYLLFLGMLPSAGLIGLILATCLLSITAVEKRDWVLMSMLAIMSYGSLIWWLNQFSIAGKFPQLLAIENWMPERQLILLAGIGFFALFTVPFIGKRREIAERSLVQLILLTASLGYLLSIGWVVGYYDGFRWLVLLLSLSVIMSSFAYLSWLQYFRLSYAKYYLTVALVAFLAAIYMYLDDVSITLLWFVTSVSVLSLGFAMPSYTARMIGLGTLALTAAHYFFAILNQPAYFSGEFWLHEQVWLGCILAAYLPVLAMWFRHSSLRPRESRLVPVLTNALLMLSWWIFFALIFFEAPFVVQSILWLVLACLGIYMGKRFASVLVYRMSWGLAVVSVLKLFIVDSTSYSLTGRVINYFILGLFLVLISLFLQPISKRLARL